jgi:inosine-uridine nucleoside N-ribohydrolase
MVAMMIRWLWVVPVALLAVMVWARASRAAEAVGDSPTGTPIPVILDTDIGDDIDDTWALVMLLKNPRLDLKLVTTTNGKAEYRARIIAKLLTIAGRTDVAIGLGNGPHTGTASNKEDGWIADFPLAAYQGKVLADGAETIVDTIRQSPREMTIIAIGPLQTLEAALRRDPSIAGKANLVGMQGSLRLGYGESATPVAEYNVQQAPAAAQKVLGAAWRSIAITPLDTCGVRAMTISGKRYEMLRGSDDKLVQALLESYRIWNHSPTADAITGSTTLFDTVAVYLADTQHHDAIELETLPVLVVSDGKTVISERGRRMEVGTRWKSVEAYRDYLVRVLLSPTVPRRKDGGAELK